MHSDSSAAATWAMRPGLIPGCYPERGDRERLWIDRFFSRIAGGLGRLMIGRRSDLAKVCAIIRGRGEALAKLDRAELEKTACDLRRGFRTQGLTDPLCTEAFALIREMADRLIGLRHHDSQVMGGWCLLQGQLAEMETGEGKTLAAALAAGTAALAGIPVHVVTVNEYLVERDAQSMGPLYRALGLSVGHVTEKMTIPQRRGGYACDITYCTNKQVAFDYLRDRLTLGNRRDRVRLALEPAYASDSRMKKLLLRGLCFAIVDEADSVLVDEARTPLILTQNVDSAMAHSAYRSALRLAEKLKPGDDFVFDPVHHTAALTLAGQQKLAAMRLPGEGLWQNSRWREELVSRALHAVYRLERDRDYLVHNNKVWIIDANTGRTLPDHCWENGLHQMVEAKEKCPLTPAREQLGRLTYQRFFRRYLLLSGMTGTAREVAAELQSIYGLRVRRIPLHRPCRRIRVADRVFWRAQEKWSAVIAAVKQTQAQGRPVLIGTGSVADSELLSRQLRAAGIAHRVLNARQNQQEAAIVAAAGQEGQVTVATNMAGRGTDIPLGRGVAERGGLHVIATCFNDARRIDRQLAGRCARQGDPGSHQTIVSLEDEIFRDNGRPWMLRLLNNNWLKNIFFIDILNRWVIRDAQRRIERRHREARQALLRDERQTGRLLAFSGPLE